MRVPFTKLPGIDVQDPTKGENSLNAGIDFFIPKNAYVDLQYPLVEDTHDTRIVEATFQLGSDYYKTHGKIMPCNNTFYLFPGCRALIHSGIRLEVDYGQFGMVCNRSGLASNKSCIFGAHIVDTFYDGELMFDIHNIGRRIEVFTGGDKLAQVLFMQFISATPIEVSEDVLYADTKHIKIRGSAGFGSSDKKS